MRKDCLTYLVAAHIDVIHLSYHFAFMEHKSIEQTHCAIETVYAFNFVAMRIFLQQTRLLINVEAV